jgi:hypothetical protein
MITLAEAQKQLQDDLQIGVIDEFRKNNFLLDNLTFDDVVSPTGGGSTMTYSYLRLLTQPTAQFRAINSEYTPQEVTKQKCYADLKVFGGSFQIDRIIANLGGATKEVTLQLQQKIKAAQSLFNDTVINGDSATDTNAFDGLDKAITGSTTEFVPGSIIDLSNAASINANYVEFLHLLNKFLKKLDGKPSFIGGNSDLISAIQLCAQLAGRYQITTDAFGQQVEAYNGIPLVDFGAKSGTNNTVVPTDASSGVTSLYVARLGMDGFHGISMEGQAPVKTWLPDYSTSGAVKTGEVEMVAAVALEATKAAGVMRKIKVQ